MIKGGAHLNAEGLCLCTASSHVDRLERDVVVQCYRTLGQVRSVWLTGLSPACAGLAVANNNGRR